MSLDVSQLAIKVTSDGIKEASNQLSGLSTSANNTEKRIDKLTQTIAKLMGVQTSATAAAQSYVNAMQLTGSSVAGSTAATGTLASATTQLAKAMLQLSTTLAAVNTNTNTSTASIRMHNSAMNDAHSLARGLSGSLGALWMTYGSAIPLAAGLAIGASLKGIVSVGKDVENTLEGIRVRGSETIENVGLIRDAVMDIGKGVYGPKEVADSFHTLIMAGLDASQALKGVKDALNLATIGEVPIEKAAETLVTVGTALGYTAESYSIISDVIAKTAAVSKSSVDGLSESFKQASSIGQLYKLSIYDIATSLAALSQLGIERSSAGTALKNFYKDLTAGSDKTKKALNDMGLSLDMLRDKTGKMNEMSVILQKMSDGLSSKGYSGGAQADIMKSFLGERGIKLGAEGLRLIRELTEQGTNAWVEYGEKIKDSFGFAAIGAAQMALTTENQMKSVKNSLQVGFAEAFKNIEPQIAVFSNRLKQAFGSEDFKTGIRTIGILFADMAVWIAENIGLITELVKGFLALKASMMVAEIVMGLAGAFRAVSAAMNGAALASKAFQMSLGVLAFVLTAAVTAWELFSSSRTKATTGTEAKASLQYLTDYASSLETEATRLQTQIDLINKGASAHDASAEAIRQETIAMAQQKAVAGKQDAAEHLKKSISGKSNYEIQKAAELAQSGRRTGFAAVDDLANSFKAYNTIIEQTDKTLKSVVDGVDKVREKSKTLREVTEKAAADKANKGPKGTAGVPEAKDDGAINKEANAYAQLEKSIISKVAADDEQVLVGRKLSWAEKELAEFRAQAKAGLTGLTAEHQKYIQSQLEAAVVNHKAVEDLKEWIALDHQRYEASSRVVNQAVNEAEKQEHLAMSFGRTKEAVATLELARLEDQRAALGSIDLCTRETAELDALIDAKKRVIKADQELDSKKATKKKEFVSPWNASENALKSYAEEAANQGQAIGEAMSKGFKMAEDALIDFVKTGKLNISSLADFIITEMLRSQIKQFLGTGGSTGMGMFGSLAQTFMPSMFGATGAFGPNAGLAASQGLSMADIGSAFADGGDPPMGKVSLVGEQGPELFVPKQAGTIIPNDQIGGGGNITITSSPTINIDARSDQAQIRQMVVSANAQASAELVERLQRAGKLR